MKTSLTQENFENGNHNDRSHEQAFLKGYLRSLQQKLGFLSVAAALPAVLNTLAHDGMVDEGKLRIRHRRHIRGNEKLHGNIQTGSDRTDPATLAGSRLFAKRFMTKMEVKNAKTNYS